MNKFIIRFMIAIGIFVTVLIYSKCNLSINGYYVKDIQPIIDQTKVIDYVQNQIISIIK